MPWHENGHRLILEIMPFKKYVSCVKGPWRGTSVRSAPDNRDESRGWKNSVTAKLPTSMDVVSRLVNLFKPGDLRAMIAHQINVNGLKR
ncbi:hypothetical protein OUZ56_028475 [Daphnia magna]|uniref:Uncharacterized protein n=1 Tax=Daphnia magna TaxID=35525 RepID=A0ABR0B445_9CRUS|nr:hypothetical protein OUZ56_028475 [Daphnia magna]